MAYRMPGKYSNDDDDDDGSVDDASIDISIDQGDYESQSEYEESFRDGEDDHDDHDDDVSIEEEEEEERRRPPPKRRSSGKGEGGGGGRSSRGPPRRSKSFQSDDRRLSHMGDGSGRERSSHSRRSIHDRSSGGGGGSGGRRTPRRSQTFDNSRQSIRMPRRDNSRASILDKEAIASNRARRLRAMGDGGKGGASKDVKLLRRASSFSNRTGGGGSLLGDSFSNNNDLDDEEKKDETPSRRKKQLPRRSVSNDLSALAPEERQYARTAARGVTRSKSLKAERPNLDRASKNVANRLGKMRVSTSAAPTGLKF